MNISENISKHFTRTELQCHHCGELRINQAFLQKLELLRSAINKPMIITSGYRCGEHNADVSTASVCPHTMGCAVDVAISGEDVPKLIDLALGLGFTGFGLKQHGPIAGRYIHLDAVPAGDNNIPRPRFWTYP
ncbi:MAG: D-Ala-D-Ala carboxypeptidase family metallohydrolase [Magnetococcus sp. YQC-5]